MSWVLVNIYIPKIMFKNGAVTKLSPKMSVDFVCSRHEWVSASRQ